MASANTGAMLYQLSYEATHWEPGSCSCLLLSAVQNNLIYYFIFLTVGVAYNIHEKKLSSEVKREGLHSGPPGYHFIIFPSVFQSISFEKLECLNKDGIEIELNVQFQYRARPKQLRDIILQFKDKDSYLKLLK